MNQELYHKMCALGMKRGKALWNGVVCNSKTNHYRRDIGIIILLASITS